MGQSGLLHNHYLLVTSLVAILTAISALGILGLMNSTEISVSGITIIEIENKIGIGIGIGMVGIIMFFGMLVASSIFEEHRHDHNEDENARPSDDAMNNLFAGKGIMRKALAGSLIITYIIVIGLYAEAGELDAPLVVNATQAKTTDVTMTSQSTQSLASSNNSTNNGQTEPEKIQERIPKSLLEHFTIVVSIMIGFYFGTDMLSKWMKAKYPETGKGKNVTKEMVDKINKLNITPDEKLDLINKLLK